MGALPFTLNLRPLDVRKHALCSKIGHREAILTHVDGAREGLALSEHGVTIRQVGHVVLAGHVAELLNSQVSDGLSGISVEGLVGRRRSVNLVEDAAQESRVGTLELSEVASLN